MATVKQLEANRRNAQLSSGPKSQEGKDRVRLNAIKHGLRTEVIEVLPHEDRVEFARRLDAWFEEYDPRSEIEIHRVRRAAVLTWKIERADRHEIAQLSKSVLEAMQPSANDSSKPVDPLDDAEYVNPADLASFDPSNAGERLRRYQFALQRALDRTMDQLGEPRVIRDSEPAERTSPDLAPPTEAVPASPVAADCQPQPEPPPVQPESRKPDAPIKANSDQVRRDVRTSTAPIKANSLLGGVKLASAMSPQSPTRPIVREPKPVWVDCGPAGWIDISREKR